MVLDKTLKSSLDRKEIKPVNSKGNQPWKLIGMTDAINQLKRPWYWERLRAGGDGVHWGWDD